ncbi:MAG: hypothetical protein WAN38_09655 [Terriglobales bacterium]|jgi:hypothetical protein
MQKQVWGSLAGMCTLALIFVCSTAASAQDEPKEKPPMYSYVSNWSIPRAQWAEMAKADAADQSILEKALADGTIIGYGSDTNLVHQADGPTHDDWWSAMSMAGVLNVLDKFYKSGASTSPALESATKHWDNIWVSHYYNWHSGSIKGAYTRVATYKLKADAPEDAVEKLSQHLLVPLMEKLLADGTIVEYEVDTQAIHSDAPGTFAVVFITPAADGLDKFNAALRTAGKLNPMNGPAFDSMVDFTPHRDYLARTTATYK